MRDLLDFYSETILEKYNQSHNPVDIFQIKNNLLETAIAQGMIFKDERSGRIPKVTIDVDPGYTHIEIFHSGLSWYMMKSKNFTSNSSFIMKIENGSLVSFNGQSLTF